MSPYDYDRRRSLSAAGRYYHGTSSDFDSFDLTKAGARDFGDFGLGVYLTPSSGLAKSYAYASAKKTRREPKVLAVRARVNNTANLDDKVLQQQVATTLQIPFPEKNLSAGSHQTRPRAEAVAITDYLRSLGYDSGLGRSGKEFVVFDPRLLSIERVYAEEDFNMML